MDTVTDTFYLLLDKDSSKVSIVWKVMHLVCLICIGFSGFWAAFCMGRLSLDFGYHCFLYAHLDFFPENTDVGTINRMYPLVNEINTSKVIHVDRTKWGPKSMCYFCQFVPLMSSMYSLIWFILFALCTRGGTGYVSDLFSRPWRIVHPAAVFGVISALFTFVSAVYVSNGSDVFCHQFVDHVSNNESCFNNIDAYTIYFSGTKREFVSTLVSCVRSSQICGISWIVYVLTLGFRIIRVVDFQMVQVEVSRVSSKQRLTLPSPPNTQEPQVTMATPESMSDDVEKQYGKSDRDFTLRDSDDTSLKEDTMQLQSEKQKFSSPSINFADDSPFNGDNNSICLVPLKKKSKIGFGSKGDDDELVCIAPRCNLANL